MAERPRLRVFEQADGHRFVKQMTEAECQSYLAENPTLTLVR
jgi:RecB family endonuclease NucS